ncbi:MAG: 50S ribosomal protein L6 [Patescibacteria group bacterium]|nr:50S ribosomal protein L6 [Patescibacteria group bacterium]MCL5432476.1 50S ribosomal protein L6 [Patescibacteria group bacterium]
MSRIGKKPIKIPEGVKVDVNKTVVTVTGPKGTLSFTFRPEMEIKVEGGNVLVNRVAETPKAKALHGLSRTLAENMIMGVSQGWNKGLELVGVGYRAAVEGTTLVLNVGFSHPVKFPAPAGITFEVTDNTRVNVKGTDKQLVGETAAQIHRIRPPEPYKGKGIKYIGEVIRRKAGKAAKAAGAAAGGGAK